VFVDFDGTITDVDTFDALVRAVAGDALWEGIDGPLLAGEITLREALSRQAAAVHLSRSETLAFMETHAHVDPAFGPFVAAVREHGGSIRVVSSGIATVIHDALARAGVDVDVLANDVDFAPAGWTMSFVDPSDNGHDKAAHVIAARKRGARTVYIGDGISDFAAALEADERFAKKGRVRIVHLVR
jgi:2,3-diketo-5-methylthio-1-phosphopentane phosphatase